jgi:hypothetical protein
MYIYVCSSTYFVHSITAASALGGAHAVTARRARATTLFTSLWQIISSPLQPFGLVPSATVLCGGGDGGGGSYQRRLWLKPMYAGPSEGLKICGEGTKSNPRRFDGECFAFIFAKIRGGGGRDCRLRHTIPPTHYPPLIRDSL